MERWLPAVGFENYYEVSNHGRVRSLSRWVRAPKGWRWHVGIILRPNKVTHGYLGVCFRVDGIVSPKRIHRLVMQTFKGYHGDVDHRDLDKTNNRLTNLRPASKSQNSGHMGKTSRNTSGYRGVSRHKDMVRWRAEIQINGKRKHLGLFDTAEAADLAYRTAELPRGTFGTPRSIS